MNFLDLRKVSKKYPSQNENAIDAISFQLAKGEVMAVVGENGSGKTTLLKLIYGIEDTDGGEIEFQNKKVTGPSYNLVPGHEQIKMLYQEFNLFPKHNIRENIIYNLRHFEYSYQQKRLLELIALCRLEGLENKYPAELSGGQQQRVALAKALAESPQLLLMDEPFSNLDLMLKDEIKKDVIRAVVKEGNSIIFVTHDIKDALSLSNKIMVVKDGKILQLDTPENIYQKPADAYVAYLFGNVNIIKIKDFLKAFPDLSGNKKFDNKSSDVNICLRPEYLSICKKEKSICSGKVKNVAYLGDSFELEVEVNKLLLRVNTRKKNIVKGDLIYLKLSLGKLHFLNLPLKGTI